jgi:parvulin-like peptidyl-prolyl isomerase
MIRALAVAVLVSGVSSHALAAPVGSVAVVDRPIVTLDADIIWKSEADERLGRMQGQGNLKAVLDELIDEKLFVIRAGELNLTAEESEIDAALEEIKKQNSLDDKQFDEVLKQQGYSRRTYRHDLRRQILILRAVNLEIAPRITITDADIAKVATDRKLKTPLKDAERDAIRKELYLDAMMKGRAAWVAERRKATRIVIRADK